MPKNGDDVDVENAEQTKRHTKLNRRQVNNDPQVCIFRLDLVTHDITHTPF